MSADDPGEEWGYQGRMSPKALV